MQEENELYECQVCLTYMLDNHPRTLNCLHTFCELCLQQLLKDSKVECPTCRKVSEITENDVKQLPENFMLKKMKDMEDVKTKEREEALKEGVKCNICLAKLPVFKCKECVKIFCVECKNNHDELPDYREHTVMNLCDVHWNEVTHVCKKCVEPLCMTCIVTKHREHPDSFERYDVAFGFYQEQISSLRTMMEQAVKDIRDEMDAVDIRVKVKDKMKLVMKGIRSKSAMQVRTAENIVKELESRYEYHGDVLETFSQKKNMCEGTLSQIKDLEVNTNISFFKVYQTVLEKVTEELASVNECLGKSYKCPPFAIAEPGYKALVFGTDAMSGFQAENLSKPELAVTISGSPLYVPLDIATPIGSNSVFVGDKLYVIRYSSLGKLEAQYYPLSKGEITGFSVYGNNIYIAQAKGISKIPLWPKEEEISSFFQPKVETINKILAVSETKLLITDYKAKAIFEFNPKTDITQTCVIDDPAIKGPTYINMGYKDNDPLYLVTDSVSCQVVAFNFRWETMPITLDLTKECQGVFSKYPPKATAFLPDGSILVALYKTVSCYSLTTGELVKNLLTSKDKVQYIEDMALRFPYLWLTDNYKVKCFNLSTLEDN